MLISPLPVNSHFDRWEVTLVVALIGTSVGGVEHLCVRLFTSACLLWESACLVPLPSLYSGCLFDTELCEYILYSNPYWTYYLQTPYVQ